ncbi:unnamed protein product [Effrenium voratum]|nr:unnamed protein product [Effrenium voratum]
MRRLLCGPKRVVSHHLWFCRHHPVHAHQKALETQMSITLPPGYRGPPPMAMSMSGSVKSMPTSMTPMPTPCQSMGSNGYQSCQSYPGHAMAQAPPSLHSAPAYASPPPSGPVYAAPIKGHGEASPQSYAESADSEGPFTRGFPDPASIDQQKKAYCRSLDQQLEDGNSSLQEQNVERKKQLYEAAEQQKQALLLHMEQQVKMQEMALDEQTNQAMMGLKKAALDQRAALEQQAASLTLEYQHRKMQEEFAATQAEMHRQYVDSASKLQTEVHKHQTESKGKMQREWERQLKERQEVLGPAATMPAQPAQAMPMAQQAPPMAHQAPMPMAHQAANACLQLCLLSTTGLCSFTNISRTGAACTQLLHSAGGLPVWLKLA